MITPVDREMRRKGITIEKWILVRIRPPRKAVKVPQLKTLQNRRQVRMILHLIMRTIDANMFAATANWF